MSVGAGVRVGGGRVGEGVGATVDVGAGADHVLAGVGSGDGAGVAPGAQAQSAAPAISARPSALLSGRAMRIEDQQRAAVTALVDHVKVQQRHLFLLAGMDLHNDLAVVGQPARAAIERLQGRAP